MVKQYDEILNETATSINTDIRNDRPTQFHPLPVINSLREVSSQMLAFQASPDTPDGTACSSALNAARQICYWSSLFMTMMDERNVVYPIATMPSSTLEPSVSSTLSSSSSFAVLSSLFTSTSFSQPQPASSSNVPTSSVLRDHLPYSSSHQQSPSSVIDHQPPVSVSLQFEQNSLPRSTVSSNASCTVSPSFYSLSPLLSSTLSGQPPTMYSFSGQPALSSSSVLQSQFSLHPQPLSVTSGPIQVTPSFFQQVSSFATERQPPSSFAYTPAVHSSLLTACPPVHQDSPAPVSRQLPLCQPSSSLSSTTVKVFAQANLAHFWRHIVS